jgi:arylsulfatase A-like enzyme
MRAVMVMRWPGTLPAGERLEQRVLVGSIAPTVAELLGLPDSGLAGQSLTPLWTGQGSYAPPETVYMGTLLPALRENRPEVVGVLKGNLKLIARPKKDEFKLFDVEKDPGELKDLAKKKPARLAELKKILAKIAVPAGSEDHAKPVEMDEQTAEMLEALGYISSGD